MPRITRLTVPLSAPIARVSPLAALAALVVLLKLLTLGTPAYWDEMGWVKQAHDLSQGNLLRVVPGLRPASMFWGHPPGLHLILALLWKVWPPSIASAHLLIAGFAALGVCATFLLARHLYDERTAWLAALFLLLTPVYFAQAGMFLADLPVAALGVLSVYFALTGRYRGYLVSATCMVFLKETGMALVAALVLHRLLSGRSLRRAALIDALRYSVPLFCIGAFLILQKLTTGHFFFIYDFDVKLFELSAGTVAVQAGYITRWIFVDQQRAVLTVLIGLGLLLRPRLRRPELLLFLVILLLSGYSFAVLYYLPRYLLPVLPFFALLAAAALVQLLPGPERWKYAGAFVAIGFLVWALLSQPLRGNGEFSLRYRDFVSLSQTMGRQLAAESPDAPIVTYWPHNVELSTPLLGYVPRALDVRTFAPGTRLPDDAFVLLSPLASRRDRMLREAALREGWAARRRLTRHGVELELLARGAGR